MRRSGRVALWAATALGEAVLVQAWVAVATAALGPLDWRAAVPSLPLGLAVFAAGAAVTGRWGPEERDPGWRRWLHAAVGAVVISAAYAWVYYGWARTWTGVVGVNPALATLVGAWYLWIQGSEAGGRGLAFSGMAARFPFRGTAMVACAFAGAWFVRIGYAPDNLWPILYRSVLAFFGSGLTALVLARLWQVRSWHVAVGEQDEPERVSPALAGLVLAVMAVSVGLESLGPGGALDRVGAALAAGGGALARWLEPALAAFLVPLLKALGLLVEAVRRMRTLEMRADEDGGGNDLPGNADLFEAIFIDASVLLRVAIIAGVAVAVLIMVLAMRLARRWRGADRPDLVGQEERESLGVLKNLWADLRSLWSMLLAWLGRLVGRGARLVGRGGAPAEDAEWLAAAPPTRDVRAAFRRLQHVGGRLGRPRRPAETPGRYGEALGRVLPAAAGAAGALVELYVRVRYGRLQPGPAEVAAARRALAEVEGAAAAAAAASRRDG